MIKTVLLASLLAATSMTVVSAARADMDHDRMMKHHIMKNHMMMKHHMMVKHHMMKKHMMHHDM